MTRDNNTTRKKANAVFFTATMVISMVAIGFAAAPAAAVSGVSGDDIDPDDDVESGAEVTHDISFTLENVDNADEPVELTISADQGAEFTSIDNVAVESAGGDASVSQSGEVDAGDITTSVEVDTAGENIDVTLEGATVQYPSVSQNTDVTFNVAYAGPGVDTDGNADLTPTITVLELGDAGIDADRSFDNPDAYDGATIWQGQTIAVNLDDVDGVQDEDDITLRRVTGDSSSTLADELTVESDDADQLWVVIDTGSYEPDADYFLRHDGDDLTDDASGTAYKSDGDRAEFELVAQDLDADFADDEVQDSGDEAFTTIEFDSIRGTYTMEVSADDLDEDDLESIFGEELTVADSGDEDTILLEDVNDGEFKANFTDVEAGDYEFTFDVTDSTAADSASITVAAVPEGDVNFEEQIIDENQGDIAEITIEFSGDVEDASLRIGDEDAVGYEANVSVDSGGADNVTVYFNTYTAGDDAEESAVVWVDTDDDDAEPSVELVNESDVTGILDTGDYDMDLIAGEDNFDEIADGNADTVGTLIIEDRSTDSLDLWTAPEDTELDDLDDISEAVEDESLTQTDTLVGDDVLVHELGASGLSGMFHNYSDDDATDAFINAITDEGDNGTELRIRQTAASTGPNQDRKVVDVEDSEDAFSVVADDDTYYIVMDSSELELTDDGDIEDGDVFDVRFRVVDERLLDPDTDEDETAADLYESVEAQFTYEDATGDFDADPVEVEAEDEQAITGTTNVAPGNEFNLRVRSASGVQPGFIMTQSVTVDADRTFSGAFDFSDASVDDGFTVRTQNAPFDASSDGIVVDAEEDDTPTPTPTPDEDDETPTPTPTPDEDDDETPTPTPDEDDDTPTPDEDDDDEPTEDDTPGFGAVVALIALIAAALLATRRRP